MNETTYPVASWRDYVEMCKPRVVLLMLVCAVVGMFLATPAMVPLDILALGTLGIGLVAASAAAVNHIADAEIDARMARTQRRPVATGRVGVAQGLLFSAVLGGYRHGHPVSVDQPAHRLAQPGVLGGLWADLHAVPQASDATEHRYRRLIRRGTAAIRLDCGDRAVEPGGLLLLLIIFAWTPPHFWALALDRKEDYETVGIPMLPVTHGEPATRRHILVYTLILIASSLAPVAIGMSGWLYLVAAVALGGGFLYWAVVLLVNRNRNAPMRTFRYSIVYLFALFVFLLLDHYWFAAVWNS